MVCQETCDRSGYEESSTVDGEKNRCPVLHIAFWNAGSLRNAERHNGDDHSVEKYV